MVNAVFAVVGATLVAPLTAGLVQVVVSMSGKPALSDVEIADFFFSPGGALGLMGLGTVLLALQVLGYAALLIPSRLLLQGGTCSFFEVLRVLLPALPRLLRLCGLFVVQLVGCTLPFLGMAAGIYRVLLGGNDINFYLVYKPPVFLWAGGLVVLVLLGHLWVVARLVSGWVHAFPLVLFRGEAPMVALRVSRRAAFSADPAVVQPGFLGGAALAESADVAGRGPRGVPCLLAGHWMGCLLCRAGSAGPAKYARLPANITGGRHAVRAERVMPPADRHENGRRRGLGTLPRHHLDVRTLDGNLA
jgi:hypothetical protein